MRACPLKVAPRVNAAIPVALVFHALQICVKKKIVILRDSPTGQNAAGDVFLIFDVKAWALTVFIPPIAPTSKTSWWDEDDSFGWSMLVPLIQLV